MTLCSPRDHDNGYFQCPCFQFLWPPSYTACFNTFICIGSFYVWFHVFHMTPCLKLSQFAFFIFMTVILYSMPRHVNLREFITFFYVWSHVFYTTKLTFLAICFPYHPVFSYNPYFIWPDFTTWHRMLHILQLAILFSYGMLGHVFCATLCPCFLYDPVFSPDTGCSIFS
jgi:hypothetical protein